MLAIQQIYILVCEVQILRNHCFKGVKESPTSDLCNDNNNNNNTIAALWCSFMADYLESYAQGCSLPLTPSL